MLLTEQMAQTTLEMQEQMALQMTTEMTLTLLLNNDRKGK